MNFRGVLSDKQKLIQHLEEVYKVATSEKDFYQKLQSKGLQLYYRGGKVTGIKLTRSFRFKTLGYTQNVLKELNRDLSKQKRLSRLDQIRKIQSKNRDRPQGIERER